MGSIEKPPQTKSNAPTKMALVLAPAAEMRAARCSPHCASVATALKVVHKIT